MEMKGILKTWRSIKSLTCETQSLVYLYMPVVLSVFASQDMRKQTEFDARIMEKLNLHHRSELVRFALRRGLLKADN